MVPSRPSRRMVLAGVGGLTAFIASPEHANAGGDRPVIAFFRSSPAGPFSHIVEAFRAGVAEEGLVEGESVDIAYHWGDNKLDRLPAMAEAIVESGAAVIVGNSLAIEAVRAHSDRVPMVFVLAEDPIAAGMVDNLASPSGNITGVTFYGGGQLAAKRAELLMEIAPSAKRIALLLDPNYAGSDPAREGAETLLRPLGIEIVAAEAAKPEALEATFAGIVAAKADALLVGGSPMQTSQRKKIIAFAAAHRLPAVYDQKDYVTDGGLISYGASFATAYRQAGVYAARIVRGAKTAELPVLRPSTYELVVNAVTGKALGIEIPNAVLLRADEVIE